MRRIAVLSAATLLTAIILVPQSARAQGFSVYEHDACAMARGGAGVAAPCQGGSAVFFNPAGILAAGSRWNASAGVTLIAPVGSFTDQASGVKTDMHKATYPVPFGYLTHQFGSSIAAGIGVFAPYGLTTDWPSTFAGRFLAYKTTLASIYIQPTFAIQVAPGFQVGVGVDYVRASAKVQRHVDASTLPAPAPLPSGSTLALLGVPVGTDLADALFDVSGDGWGGQIGVMWQASSKLSFGVRYMSQVKTKLTGNASFTKLSTGITLPAGNPFGVPGGTPLDLVLASAFTSALYNQSASTDITMPSQIVAGLAYKVTTELSVMADYQYTDWTVFKTLNLSLDQAGQTVSEYEHFKATSAFRGGFEWQTSPKLTIRGGLLTHNGASPDETVTPVLPEGQRFEGTLGAGIALTTSLRLNIAYQYIQQQDRRGRMYDPAVGDPMAAMNHGLFKFTANLFGASLALAF